MLIRPLLRALPLTALLALASLPTPADAGDRSLASALRGAAAQSDRLTWQSLDLTPVQMAKLAAIFWDAKAGRDAFRAQAQSAMDAARAELARDDADLDAIVALTEPLTNQRIADARRVRDQLIAFYNDDLDAAQQATARQILLQRLERISELQDALESLGTLFGTP